MATVFLKLLNLSISASWLVLAVLVLRLVSKRSPKWMNVLLWGMVALRLMLPFSIESALSLIPSAETLSPEVVRFDPAPTITSGVEFIDNAVLRLYGLCGGHGDRGLFLRGGRRFRGHRRRAGGRALLAVGRGGAACPGPGLFIQLGPGRHAHGDLLFRAGQLAGGIGIFFCHDGSLGDAAAPTR